MLSLRLILWTYFVLAGGPGLDPKGDDEIVPDIERERQERQAAEKVKEYEETKKEYEETKKEYDKKKKEYEEMKKEYEETKKEYDKKKKEYDKKKKELDEKEKELDEKEEGLEAARMEEIERLTSAIAVMDIKLKTAEEAVATYKALFAQTAIQLDDLRKPVPERSEGDYLLVGIGPLFCLRNLGVGSACNQSGHHGPGLIASATYGYRFFPQLALEGNLHFGSLLSKWRDEQMLLHDRHFIFSADVTLRFVIPINRADLSFNLGTGYGYQKLWSSSRRGKGEPDPARLVAHGLLVIPSISLDFYRRSNETRQADGLEAFDIFSIRTFWSINAINSNRADFPAGCLGVMLQFGQPGY